MIRITIGQHRPHFMEKNEKQFTPLEFLSKVQ